MTQYKKYVLAAALVMVAVFVPKINVAQAQVVACPAGFICTPINPQPTQWQCPVGYICTPSNPTNPIPTPTTTPQSTDATARVAGGSLVLTYDNQSQEALLLATSSILVNGGTNGIYIYKDGLILGFMNQNGTIVSTGPITSSLSSSVTSGTTVDSNGRTLYYVAPGQYAAFNARVSTNPKQMFAGTYRVVWQSLYANVSTSAAKEFSLNIAGQPTNSKTIIGEVSPYITTADNSNPSSVGATVTLRGQRLTGSTLLIDNAPVPAPLTFLQNGTVATFVVPQLANGSHVMALNNTRTGASNNFTLNIGSGTSQNATVTRLGATGSMPGGTIALYVSNFPQGSSYRYYVSFTGPATDTSVPATLSPDGTYLAFVVPNLNAGTYQITGGAYSSFSASNYLPFTIISSGPTTNPPQPQPTGTKREQIRQLYLTLQHREPEQQGWDYWTNYSDTIENIRTYMMQGIEYQTKQKIAAIFAQCGKGTPSDLDYMKWYYTAEYNNYNVDVVRTGLGCGGTTTTSSSVVISVDPSSPISRTVAISDSTETNDVVLAVFDVKSQGKAGYLQGLTLGVITSKVSVPTLFSDIKIKAGGVTYVADTLSNSGASFGNLQIALPADQYVPVFVYGKIPRNVNGNLSGSSASVTLNSGSLSVIDKSYNKILAASANLTSSVVNFLSGGTTSSDPMISNTIATLGDPIVIGNNTVAYPVSFSYTLTAGNNTLYISNNIATAVRSAVSGEGTINLTDTLLSPATLSGDSSNYFIIPAGSSRTITLHGAIRGTGLVIAYITGLNYGQSASSLQAYTMTSNLIPLKVSPILSRDSTPITPVSTPPYVAVKVTPNPIGVGETTTVSWSSTNANSCAADGIRTNGATSGSVQVKFTVPTTVNYSITCIGNGGSKTETASLTVTQSSQPAPTVPAPITNTTSDRQEQVRQLYLTLQYREPDSGGLNYWVNSSYTIDQMRASMMQGVEYQTKQRIIGVFKEVLSRMPSNEEIATWYTKAEQNGYNVDVVRTGLKAQQTTTTNTTSSVWNAVKSLFSR